MSYIVYCDDVPIYDLRNDDLLLIDPTLELELNSAGKFTFKMPLTHPCYDLPQKMTSRILVEQDGDEIFKGRIIGENTDFYRRKEIICEGELAFLNDSIQRPGEYHDITPREYLEALIASHNAQVDESRQFTVGIVTVEDPNDSLYRYTNMNSTWTEIKEDLVDDLGGYLKVRNENGIRYLDYVNIEDYGDTSSQAIEFGKNLLDFTSDIDMTDICTGIIPLGATLEESDFSALDVRLTIEDVNDGVDYIQIDEAVEEYGLILKTVTWDSVTTPEMLLSKARSYLSEYQWESMTIEAKAVDLHLTDEELMRFKLGDYIEVVSKPHGLDKYFPLSEMKIYLSKPSSNTVMLGEAEDISLSAKTSTISSGLSSVSSAIPSSYTGFLQSAINQASALITAATHGYVMLNDVDDDGYPDELVIMDTDDTETATKVWRWNLNGLGYSSTGYNGEYGTAITMDGQIVGSYIAAGTITAEQLSVEYTTSVSEEISETIDDVLTNYYTQSEITQLFEANNGTLLSQISQTYLTSDDASNTYATISTVTQTSNSLTALIEDTQNSARTYFAADSNSITVSSGSVTFSSNTFAVNSTYFTVTDTGVITATSGTIGGFTLTSSKLYNGKSTLTSSDSGICITTTGISVGDGSSSWMTFRYGRLYGAGGGNEDYNGYLSFNNYYTTTGLYGTRLTGEGIICLYSPYLGVGDYVEYGDSGTVSVGQSGSMKAVTSVTANSDTLTLVGNLEITSSDGVLTSASWTNYTRDYVTGLTRTYQTVTFKNGLMVTDLS